jgi:hypothetical protein
VYLVKILYILFYKEVDPSIDLFGAQAHHQIELRLLMKINAVKRKNHRMAVKAVRSFF